MSVVRSRRRQKRGRANLATAGTTEAQWRERWEAERLFLTADGERDKAWGNETIRFNPDEGWLEVKLPGPLGQLANHGRTAGAGGLARSFSPTGVMRSRRRPRPERSATTSRSTMVTRRWYLDASWKTAPGPAPDRGELRLRPVVAVDVAARRSEQLVPGILSAKFRDRLTQMTQKTGLAVIATDPAYTSRWERRALACPLKKLGRSRSAAITPPPW